MNRGADKSLARPRKKQARKHVRNVWDFNKIETRAVIMFLFPQGKAPKEIHVILTETLAYFLPGRAKDLSAPLYINIWKYMRERPTRCKLYFLDLFQSYHPQHVSNKQVLHQEVWLKQVKEIKYESYWSFSHIYCKIHGSENVKLKSILYYKHIKPPTCTCFGHTCGHPQGGVNEGYFTNILPM